MSIERWGTFEWAARSDVATDALETGLRAIFRRAAREVAVEGFFDGDGLYRVRFMPDEPGDWEFRVESSLPQLDGATGAFRCVEPAEDNHGPVQVRDQFHFAFADGTRFLPFGTTCYAWVHQHLATQKATLSSLRASPFNKIRMCVFPKFYIYNEGEPVRHPFERQADGSIDFDRPDPIFFGHLEQRIGDLRELGIEADLILFHPYDRWGYSRMTLAQDEHYMRYVVARLGAYRNVWWSIANEFDLMDKSPDHWQSLIATIRSADPYGHLTSIHNAGGMYDHSRPEITHLSIQNWDVKRTQEWRDLFGKPVVNDEPEYEGDIPMPWGNISPQELVHRFWVTFTRGGYAGHGETYLDPDDVLWWAKGGHLRGESPARIAFLRGVVESAPGPLTPIEPSWVWERVSGATAPGYTLIYFGEHQPRNWFFGLPIDGGDYAIDLIDTWAMTTTELHPRPLPRIPRMPGAPDGPAPTFSVDLPGKSYMAVRIRRKNR